MRGWECYDACAVGLVLLASVGGCGGMTEPNTPSIEQGLCESHPNDPCCPGSPIILDLNGDGFALTDRNRGVPFDLRATGGLSMFAWTAPGSDDAWLVLDRNGNGSIDDGTEMFGNFSEQPKSAARNGFLALAMFDEAMAGGNNDRKIDINDKVFSELRLWQDLDHDGISEPSELLTLSQAGITALGLDYSMSSTTDEYGNNFRYVAEVQREEWSRVAPFMYDVFLTVHSVKPESAKALDVDQPDLPGPTPPDPDTAAVGVPCMGTFTLSTATVFLQQSRLVGVPWGVQLSSVFSGLGTVAFTAEIWVNTLSKRYNGYQEHQEDATYLFHGPLPIPFQLVGGGDYSLKPGDHIHFGFNWHPISNPPDEHSAVVDCVFFPPDPPPECGN